MKDSVRNLDMNALERVAGRSFFYPCAWEDWNEPLDAFGDLIDEFHFVDVGYQFSRPVPIRSDRWVLQPEYSGLTGPAVDTMRFVVNGSRRYREIDPAWCRERYLDRTTGKAVSVTRRRGFGQIALDELPDNSLGVFCHRGDSSVEGGSCTWYLANLNKSYAPLSRLFEKIKRKLAYPALIVSDGSNTSIRQIRDCCAERAGGEQTLSLANEFDHFGLHWQRVGELNVDLHRRTYVWLVERNDQ